jgi:L-fuculose-phosphate aldolase
MAVTTGPSRASLMDLARAIADVGDALFRAGLVRGRSGNLSTRSGDTLLITAAGASLDNLGTDSIVRVADAGKPPAGVSSEFHLHAEIYARRPDVQAIAHTHSPYATAWSCVARRLELPLEEAHYYGMAKTVKVARQAPAGSRELARLAAEGLGDGMAVLLERHGAVVVGANVDEARCCAESLEHQAQVAWLLSAPMTGVRSSYA